MIDASKLKYCRLYKGNYIPEILNFNLRYAYYAEAFYCSATAEQDKECIEDLKFYNISTSAYKGIPLALIAHLFSVWSNKLAGGSAPDKVVPGFHNRFMKEYLLVNKEDGLLDMWFVHSNYSGYGHGWSYYLDKCIYFKGTALTPDSIIKADKQYIERYEYEWIMMHYPSENGYPTEEEQDGYLKKLIFVFFHGVKNSHYCQRCFRIGAYQIESPIFYNFLSFLQLFSCIIIHTYTPTNIASINNLSFIPLNPSRFVQIF